MFILIQNLICCFPYLHPMEEAAQSQKHSPTLAINAASLFAILQLSPSKCPASFSSSCFCYTTDSRWWTIGIAFQALPIPFPKGNHSISSDPSQYFRPPPHHLSCPSRYSLPGTPSLTSRENFILKFQPGILQLRYRQVGPSNGKRSTVCIFWQPLFLASKPYYHPSYYY